MAQPGQKMEAAMPKVDMVKDAKILSQAQLDYMRLAQQQNVGKFSTNCKLFAIILWFVAQLLIIIIVYIIFRTSQPIEEITEE